MPSRRPARLLLVALMACVPLAGSTADAQDLIGKLNARLGAEPDPLAMLRQSAERFGSAEHASFTLLNTLHIVAGERDTSDQFVFEVKIAAGDKLALEEVKPSEEFIVRSDGQKTMTYIELFNQYSIEEGGSSIGAFADSKLAEMMGNGLAPLVFSTLDPKAVETLIKQTTESSYVGEEQQQGGAVQRFRYTTEGMTWDAWFTTDNEPRLQRVLFDLTKMASQATAAKQYDNFKFEISFDIKDFNAEAEIPATAFALTPPEGAAEVENALAPPPPPPHALLGKRAPVFDTVTPAGQPIDLGELIGKKVIILDFWATWCGPCVAAMPRIDKVADEFADQGVVLFAVNQGDDAQTVKQFLKAQELDVPVAMDTEGAAAVEYEVEGLPTSVIIGKDGRVQVVHVGYSESLEAMLRGELQQLVAGVDLAAKELAAWEKAHPKTNASEAN